MASQLARRLVPAVRANGSRSARRRPQERLERNGRGMRSIHSPQPPPRPREARRRPWRTSYESPQDTMSAEERPSQRESEVGRRATSREWGKSSSSSASHAIRNLTATLHWARVTSDGG